MQNATEADQGALKTAKQSAKKAQAEASHLQQELKQAKDSEAEAAKLRKSLAKAQEKLAAVNAEVGQAPAEVVLPTAASIPCAWGGHQACVLTAASADDCLFPHCSWHRRRRAPRVLQPNRRIRSITGASSWRT